MTSNRNSNNAVGCHAHVLVGMSRTISAATVLFLFIISSLFAADPNLNDLTEQLIGNRPALERTDQQLTEAYSAIVDSLLPDLANEDLAKRSASALTVEHLAFHASRPDAEIERSALAKVIAASVNRELPLFTKSWLIRQLERIGRAESAASLAKLLEDADPIIRDCACRALAKNSAPEAAEPLRKALAAADTSTWQIVLISAISSRRDPADMPLIKKFASSENDSVCIAALRGLANIGDKAAIEPLLALMQKGSPQVRQAATDCFITLANHLGDMGDEVNAVAIYSSIAFSPLPTASAPRAAGIIGLGRFGPGAFPQIFEAANDPDFRVRGAVAEALAVNSDKNIVPEIATRFPSASPEAKVVFLRALTIRKDKSGLPTLVTAATDSDANVRATAIRGFVSIGDASVIPIVVKAATTDGDAQTAARFALDQMAGADINGALLAYEKDADGRTKVELARAFGTRRVYGATPSLIQSAADADPAVRRESIRALGLLVDNSSMPALLMIMAGASKDDRDTAIDAVTNAAKRLPEDIRSDAIAAAFLASEPETRVRLIAVAPRIGGAKLLAVVRPSLADADPEIQSAAIRALADWPDAGPADDLLAIAKGATDETRHVIALRGYIRLARLASDRPGAERARLFVAGLQTARRADEKRQAIGGLAEVRHITALEAVTPLIADPALAQEAAVAVVLIGRDIVNDNPDAVKSAMQKVVETSKNADNQKQAKEILDRAEQKLKK